MVRRGWWGDGPGVDLHLARQAFVHTFIELAKRLPSLDRRSADPLADLLGDWARHTRVTACTSPEAANSLPVKEERGR
jgi:hypothetical protein